MRPHLVLLVALLLADGTARAEEPASTAPERTWSPLRVALECQSEFRVGVCDIVRGFVDHMEVLASAPRSDAQVVVYVNVTRVANDEHVQLRFTSEVPRTPPMYELVQRVDSRAPVDAQIATLEPAFRRGIAVYLSVVNPDAVTVAIAVPAGAAKVAAPTTPWGASLWGGSWGEWSENYQSLSTWAGASVFRLANRSRGYARVAAKYDLSREPSLEVDAASVSLDTEEYEVGLRTGAERHLTDTWSAGAIVRAGHEDPEGQYLGTVRAHAGVERDWFPSDDPRGNQLAVAYIAGVQSDWYNQLNALGEERAVFPTHGLLSKGSVRVDRAELSLEVGAGAEVLRPDRRYVLMAQGNLDLAVGDHVDLWMSLGVTQQAIPGPAELDRSSFEAVTRADYAEPLSLDGELDLRFHWDNTNGARNNRFTVTDNLGTTDNL